jgi:hypothetical protein
MDVDDNDNLSSIMLSISNDEIPDYMNRRK